MFNKEILLLSTKDPNTLKITVGEVLTTGGTFLGYMNGFGRISGKLEPDIFLGKQVYILYDAGGDFYFRLFNGNPSSQNIILTRTDTNKSLTLRRDGQGWWAKGERFFLTNDINKIITLKITFI